jgi:hypothetical protein
LANITITDEQEFRAAFLADLETFVLAGNVFPRRRSVNSRADFFKKLGKVVSEKTEIRFVEIDLLNIEDNETEGFDDCPVANLTYGLHLFHEFADIRSDDTNSDTDFTELLLLLRSFFLSKRDYVLTNFDVQTDPIKPADFTQFGNDTFTDTIGHFKNLTLVTGFYDK